MDRIIVNEIVCYAYHGVLPEENTLGQEFRVSIELGIDLSGHKNDQIDQVTDYRQAIAIVEEIMYEKPCRLLETLACTIADKLLQIPEVLETTVEISKPHPPIPRVSGGISVVINKRK